MFHRRSARTISSAVLRHHITPQSHSNQATVQAPTPNNIVVGSPTSVSSVPHLQSDAHLTALPATKFNSTTTATEREYSNTNRQRNNNQRNPQGYNANNNPSSPNYSKFIPRYNNRYGNNANYVNHRAATYYMTPHQANTAVAIVNANSDNGSSIASVSSTNVTGARSYSTVASTTASSMTIDESMSLLNLSLNANTSSASPANEELPSPNNFVAFSPENPDPRKEMYVDTEEDLLKLVEICKAADTLAVDLEFVSFPLYRPSLQLLQIATPNSVVAAVDCQVLQGMLLPLIELINTKEIILHGGSTDLQVLQDLELEYDIAASPAVLFDTQTAASFIGLGETGPISLGNLIDELLNVHLEKGLGSSDWGRRPLSPEQVSYALDDVRYLHQAQHILIERMRQAGPIPSSVVSSLSSDPNKSILLLNREQLFRAEMEMTRLHRYEPVTPNDAWLQVKTRPGALSDRATLLLKSLAKWREMEGLRQNKSPRFLVKDEVLVSVAQRPPQSEKDIDALGYAGSYLYKNAHIILTLIQTIEGGDAVPVTSEHATKTHLDRAEESLRQIMLATASAISQSVSMSVDLLLPFGDLKTFLLATTEEDEDATSVMRGFRRELIGVPLRKIKQGQAITLRWDPVERKITF